VELNKQLKKILLITPGQPSLNPRLVKEADSLANAGYEVTVLYAYWNSWGDQLNSNLLLTKKWKAIYAGGHPVEKPVVYFFSRLIHKLAKWLFNTFNLGFCAELAITRGAGFLVHEAKKHRAGLYIGHNLGALAATVKAAKKHNAKCGFDAEDLHRYEVSDNIRSAPYRTAKYIEDKYYLSLDYVTASSPQISEAYQQLYPDKKPVTILNVFPKSAYTKQRIINKTGPVRLFWFSQTIGNNRGLDDIAKAIKFLRPEDFELHILGYIADDAKHEFINNTLMGISNIFFYDPLPPDDIINFASQFDVGLALEPGFSINNELALSNKLFSYLQSGLAIIVSDTTAQEYFISGYPEAGKIYHRNDLQSLTPILSAWQLNRETLYNTCEAALMLGREKLNWENESIKFLSLIKETLNNN